MKNTKANQLKRNREEDKALTGEESDNESYDEDN